MELLGKLQFFIHDKGFRPFRDLTLEDPVEDIRYEVYRAQRDFSKKRNIKMMQKGLVTVAAGIEMINRRYNWLNMRLEGYSKSVLLSIREYDDIFEELHWKYCDAMSMPVEMKLLVTMASSVWFFHMSNSSAPGSGSSDPPAFQFASSDAAASPPPRPPVGGQSKMSGPRVRPMPSAMPGGGMGGDMSNLFSGLSMVQTLLNAT